MISLNRIFLALCLLSTSSAFSITAELLNRLKRELAEVETVLTHSKDLSEKLKMAKLGKRTIATLSQEVPGPRSNPAVFKVISFQGITANGGTRENVQKQLKLICEKLKSIEKSLEAEQRAQDKALEERRLAEQKKKHDEIKNQTLDEITAMAINYEKTLDGHIKLIATMAKKLGITIEELLKFIQK